LNTISDKLGVGAEEVSARFEVALESEAADSVEKMFEVFGARYYAPVDTTQMPFEDNTFGMCFSNLVLTHIPLEILQKVLAESLRILVKDGIAIHRMKFNDVDMLKYSSIFWDRYLNSPISYNNRLYVQQIKDIFAEVGYELIDSVENVDKGQIERLDHIEVAEEFRGMSREELATRVFIGIWRKP